MVFLVFLLSHKLSSRAKRRISCTPTLCFRDSSFGRLNDNMVEVLLFVTPPSPLSKGEILLSTQIVIQSEAKDLVYTHFMFSRFFAPLCFALNDK